MKERRVGAPSIAPQPLFPGNPPVPQEMVDTRRRVGEFQFGRTTVSRTLREVAVAPSLRVVRGAHYRTPSPRAEPVPLHLVGPPRGWRAVARGDTANSFRKPQKPHRYTA
jgi:hypothetical protein